MTATDAGKIVKLNGHFSEQRSALLEAKLNGQEAPFLPVFQHGIDREPVVAAWVAENFGIQPNSLLCRGENPRHLATPDGIGPGVVAEIKTSSRPLKETLGTYRDQLQWQLHVTQSERLLFVVENRDTFRRETLWVERDDYRIFILAAHVDAFIQELDDRRVVTGIQAQEPSPSLSAEVAAEPAVTFVRSTPSAIPPSPGAAITNGERAEPEDDEFRTWTEPEREMLIGGYGEAAGVDELARSLGTTSRAVVFELSRLMLAPSGPMVDATAARFGLFWDSGEERVLRNLYSDGTSLPEIARKMQRDQLGVAFRLFGNHIPPLPAEPTPEAEVPTTAARLVPEVPLELVSESAGMGPGNPEPMPSTAVTVSEANPRRAGSPTVRNTEDLVHPETIVSGIDPDNDSDDNRYWSPAEIERLLQLYGDNEDLEIRELARHFRTTSRAVVIALAHTVLEPQGQLEDPSFPKRGWTQGDVDLVHDSFRAGASLYQIAQATSRDQLSVAFRLLGDRLPEVSGFIEEFRTA